jgi:hypothetical protein
MSFICERLADGERPKSSRSRFIETHGELAGSRTSETTALLLTFADTTSEESTTEISEMSLQDVPAGKSVNCINAPEASCKVESIAGILLVVEVLQSEDG